MARCYMKTNTGPKILEDESSFNQWKQTLIVPKRTSTFSCSIEKYIRQRDSRKVKEKYGFIEYLPYNIQWELKEKYKLKNLVQEERTLDIKCLNSRMYEINSHKSSTGNNCHLSNNLIVEWEIIMGINLEKILNCIYFAGFCNSSYFL